MDFDGKVDSSLLPAHLADCLRDVDADAVTIMGNRVTFRGGIFRFVTNANVLVPFGFGDLTVSSETREIRYRLSYQQLVIFSATVAGGIIIPVSIFIGFRGLSGGMLALPLLWCLVVFIRLAIGISQFQGFISRAVSTAPKKGR